MARRVRRLLLVTHRSLDQHGGPTARWRSLQHHLPLLGWEVDVLAAPARASADEFRSGARSARAVERRARSMGHVGRLVDPLFGLAGVQPEAFPLSMAWLPRGARDVRRALAARRYDAVVATGPPMIALLAARAARRAGDPPLVVELRDLWAGNPSFDRRGELLGALERWIFGAAAAVVACTPEAAEDVRRRHPRIAERVHDIPNGFEAALLERHGPPPEPGRVREILHSGTLTAGRPMTPLLDVLAREPYRSRFRLVLHGYMTPAIAEQVAAADVEVQTLPPSGWEDAVARIAAADVAMISQADAAGDATAVAGKVYEYLALGRPVLCVSDGGATEALLGRLGADRYCARLGDPDSIATALDRLLADPPPEPLPPERLKPYERGAIAERMAALLDGVASASPTLGRMVTEQKSRVQAFWEEDPCGAAHASAPEGSPEFFAEVERKRNELEPFIAPHADFAGARGQRLLEIGVGVGTDFIRFVRAGAQATGVDLTEHAVRLVRRRLELECLEADVRQADAENLPFEDGAFDRVYSWGVLHHSPDTERTIAEALRVLRPGGTATIMLYSRHSWVTYGLWAKYGLLRGKPQRTLTDVLAHHMESEGTKGYSVRELRRMFSALEDLRVDKVATPYDRGWAGPLAVVTGDRLGWFSVIRGRKPA